MALRKISSSWLLGAVCAILILSPQAWAAELVTGMNTNIQVWSDKQRDTLLEDLKTAKVHVIRCGLHQPEAYYIDYAKRLYDSGIKIDLLVGCGYPQNTPTRPESKQWGVRAARPLSYADPAIAKANYQKLMNELDDKGVVLEALELENEINWADFNGDFPVPGQGKIFTFEELSTNPEAKVVAKGFLQYLKCLAALKDARDHSRLNHNTPIMCAGLCDFDTWPPPKMRLDSVSLDATIRFFQANGIDKLVDAYAFHSYPKLKTAEERKKSIDKTLAYTAPPNAPKGKPGWITEWGIGVYPDEKESTKVVKDVMGDFRQWAKQGRLIGVLYFSWNYLSPTDVNHVFRDGKLQPLGKEALKP